MNLIKKILKIEFVKNSSNYFVGNIVTTAISFLTLPIFTRLLSPSDYGNVNVFTSLLSVNTIIFSLGFPSAISNKYLKEKDEFKQFLGTNLLFLFIFQLFLLFILININGYISELFNVDRDILLLANISGVLMVAYHVYQHFLKASLQSKKFVFLGILYSILGTVLSLILIMLIGEDKYIGRIFGYIISILVLSSISLVYLIKNSEFKFKKKHLIYAITFGIPFLPHLLSQFILGTFDRIIINQITGSVNTGLYSLAYNVGGIQNALSIALISAFIPQFYKCLNERKYSVINNKVKNMTIIFLFGSLLLILFSKEIIILMSDKKFHSAFSIIPWVMLGNVFFYFYMIYSVYATYEKKTGIFSLITLFVGVISITLNYLLIPIWGYKMAAVNTCFSYFMLFLFHFLNAKFILKKTVIRLKTYIVNLIGFLLLVFLSFAIINIDSYFLNLLLRLVVLIIGGLFLFRNSLSMIISFIKKRI